MSSELTFKFALFSANFIQMKLRFFLLIAIVSCACACTFPSARAQEAVTIQEMNREIQQTLKYPSNFPLSLSSSVNQSSLDNFQERSIPFNDSATATTFFQCRRPFNIYSVGIPALGIGYGFLALHSHQLRSFNLAIKNEIREDHPNFQTHVDNYLQWSPAAAVIALNLLGVHGTKPFKEELGIYTISTIIMAGTVYGLKRITHEDRPDYSSFTSFPSGHTATVFAAAEWLRMEYGHRSPWIGIAGYAVATSVGVLRVYNNRHWVSDVIAGAAVGFLSTRISYVVYPWMKSHIFHSNRKAVQGF